MIHERSRAVSFVVAAASALAAAASSAGAPPEREARALADRLVSSSGDGVLDCVDQCPGVDDAIFAPGCADAIPTVSVWGVVVMALLLLTGGKVHFGRRRSVV